MNWTMYVCFEWDDEAYLCTTWYPGAYCSRAVNCTMKGPRRRTMKDFSSCMPEGSAVRRPYKAKRGASPGRPKTPGRASESRRVMGAAPLSLSGASQKPPAGSFPGIRRFLPGPGPLLWGYR